MFLPQSGKRAMLALLIKITYFNVFTLKLNPVEIESGFFFNRDFMFISFEYINCF